MNLKKHHISSFTIAFFLIGLVSCDVLDKQPLDVIPETIVWNDESLIDSYLTGAYI